MPRVRQHIEDIAHLAVRAIQPGIDHDRNRSLRVQLPQTFDYVEREVRLVVDAEQVLYGAGIILLAESRQVFEQRLLVPMQGLDDSHTRKRTGLRARAG